MVLILTILWWQLNFEGTFDVVTTANAAFDLTRYSGAGALSKSICRWCYFWCCSTPLQLDLQVQLDGKVLKISLTGHRNWKL